MRELVEIYLKQMGLARQFKEQEVCRLWPEVVGEMIASRTQSVRMAGGKLFVRFTSSVVKHEILLVKEGLLKKLNECVGENLIKDIVVF